MELLDELHHALTTTGKAALNQATALSGLGGIGKTQTVVEYAYRYFYDTPTYEWVFWVRADTELNVVTGLADIARSLQLAEGTLEELATRSRTWFETHPAWLLIFDNAGDPAILKPWLPQNPQGRVLLTSRSQRFTSLGIKTPITVQKLSLDESIAFLCDRTQRSNMDTAELAAVTALAKALDGLPLALEQAAAYIDRVGVSFQVYWQYYRRQQLMLLEKGLPETGDYPQSVATTWLLNFEAVEQRSPASIPILQLSAVLATDDIDEQLLLDCAKEFGLVDCTDELALAEQLAALAEFSLIQRERETATYSIHRMVQAVVWQRMPPTERQDWMQQAIAGLRAVFPDVTKFENWVICGKLVPHVQMIAQRSQSIDMETLEWAKLFGETGYYLKVHGRYEEAESFYQRALAVEKQRLGHEHRDVAKSLNNLATVYHAQGHYREAEPLYQRSLAIGEKDLGHEPLDIATWLNNLAELYRAQGRYLEAEPLYQRAIAISEQQLGREHPDIAKSLNNLALLYYNQGRYLEAEPLYQRAIAISEQQLGREHPDIATWLNNMALLYSDQGRYDEAKLLYQRALAISEQYFGIDHPDIAIWLNNLATLYSDQGCYDEAKLLYQRALAISEHEHPNVANLINNLALIYSAQGAYGEVEPLYQRALAISEQYLEHEHSDVATSLNNLANLYYAQERHGEAELLYLRSLDIFVNQLGDNHPNTQTGWQNFCYFIQEVIATGKTAQLSDHPVTQRVVREMGDVEKGAGEEVRGDRELR